MANKNTYQQTYKILQVPKTILEYGSKYDMVLDSRPFPMLPVGHPVTYQSKQKRIKYFSKDYD